MRRLLYLMRSACLNDGDAAAPTPIVVLTQESQDAVTRNVCPERRSGREIQLRLISINHSKSYASEGRAVSRAHAGFLSNAYACVSEEKVPSQFGRNDFHYSVDWRVQVRERPLSRMALAFGAGILLSAFATRRWPSYARSEPRLLGTTRREWNNVKEALAAIVLEQGKDFARQMVPQFGKEY